MDRRFAALGFAVALSAAALATGLAAEGDGKGLNPLFEQADKLCAYRYPEGTKAYEQCQVAQYIAVTRLVAGMNALPDQNAVLALVKDCLVRKAEMKLGLPDYDAALTCLVEQVPESKKLFFWD